MSQLTVGLAVVGGLVLAAVVAHGAWTARRKLPQANPPLSADERTEPGLTPAGAAHTRDDADMDMPANLLPSPNMGVERKLGLDALIDAIAQINLGEPGWVSGEAAIAALPTTRRVGTKPFFVEGLNAQTQQWEAPQPQQRYTAFQSGVQLVNRNGALNDIEFSEFVQKTTACADAFDADCEFPEMRDEVARARELDQFAQEHDAQLSFTLRPRSVSWSPGYLQQNAAQLGFVAGAMPGRMVLPAQQTGLPPLLVLSFDTAAALADDPELSALRECKLSLDAPQVRREEQAFVRMRDAAITLCARMDGVLCDEAGNRIPAEALDAIGADLERLYDSLDERDLSAGSPQARRMFS
jgi:hypothetical protein